jgi:hypothetical protein
MDPRIVGYIRALWRAPRPIHSAITAAILRTKGY